MLIIRIYISVSFFELWLQKSLSQIQSGQTDICFSISPPCNTKCSLLCTRRIVSLILLFSLFLTLSLLFSISSLPPSSNASMCHQASVNSLHSFSGWYLEQQYQLQPTTNTQHDWSPVFRLSILFCLCALHLYVALLVEQSTYSPAAKIAEIPVIDG